MGQKKRQIKLIEKAQCHSSFQTKLDKNHDSGAQHYLLTANDGVFIKRVSLREASVTFSLILMNYSSALREAQF